MRIYLSVLGWQGWRLADYMGVVTMKGIDLCTGSRIGIVDMGTVADKA